MDKGPHTSLDLAQLTQLTDEAALQSIFEELRLGRLEGLPLLEASLSKVSPQAWEAVLAYVQYRKRLLDN
jgi:hypothetical protein